MTNFIIGVAGGSGSGKSTVTKQIIQSVADVCVVYQDNYYKDYWSNWDFEKRETINFDHPDAFDWELMASHLNSLRSGNAVDMPEYDFNTHSRAPKTVRVEPSKIIIVEGILALYDDSISKQMALRIFVDTAADVRFIRRLKRDIYGRSRTLDSVLQQYTKSVRPMYNQFVEPTKRKAHIIIPHGSNRAALEMIISRINSVIDEKPILLYKDGEIAIDDDQYIN